jgi:hypothetical protein
MMDDKFLYQLREQPHPEFAATLRHKLKLSQPALPRWKPAFSFGVIGLLLVVTLFSATPVRSAFLSFLTRVGGLPFEVTTGYPGDDSKVEIIEPRHLLLDEAIMLFPAPVHLPQNVVLEQEVSLYDFGQGNFHIILVGQTQQGIRFHLTILTSPDPSGGEIIFPDSVEEIFLDADHPAALIRGGWNYDTKAWDDAYGTVRIKWTLDNLLYDLGGNVDNLETLLEVARTTLP